MNDTLTIRLGDHLSKALNDEARLSGLSKGEIARQALQFHLQRGGRLRVMRHYFGAMRGPADLSTNKTYRKEWPKTKG
jgi:hypothetical protein